MLPNFPLISFNLKHCLSLWGIHITFGYLPKLGEEAPPAASPRKRPLGRAIQNRRLSHAFKAEWKTSFPYRVYEQSVGKLTLLQRLLTPVPAACMHVCVSLPCISVLVHKTGMTTLPCGLGRVSTEQTGRRQGAAAVMWLHRRQAVT